MEGASVVTRRLAVTRRCLEEDLGIVGRHWRDAVSEFPVLQAFADRRAQSPQGRERILDLMDVLRAPIFSLHSGADRAATWYDEDEDIVWLLAVGRSHDYDHILDLGRRGRLMPGIEDYDQFEPETTGREFAESLVNDARRLVEQAWMVRDEPVEGVLAGRIRVRVCIETDDPDFLVVAVSERLVPGEVVLPKEWQLQVAATFFPGVDFGDFNPFPLEFDNTYVRDDELALRWFAPWRHGD